LNWMQQAEAEMKNREPVHSVAAVVDLQNHNMEVKAEMEARDAKLKDVEKSGKDMIHARHVAANDVCHCNFTSLLLIQSFIQIIYLAPFLEGFSAKTSAEKKFSSVYGKCRQDNMSMD